MQTIDLPWPPSMNHYWRHVGSRVLISRQGREYRAHVVGILQGCGPRKPPASGRVAMVLDVYPPDRRRRDLDNLQKPVLDALEHAGLYENDSQVAWLLTRRRAVVPGGALTVTLEDYPLIRCPSCGAAYSEK